MLGDERGWLLLSQDQASHADGVLLFQSILFPSPSTIRFALSLAPWHRLLNPPYLPHQPRQPTATTEFDEVVVEYPGVKAQFEALAEARRNNDSKVKSGTGWMRSIASLISD